MSRWSRWLLAMLVVIGMAWDADGLLCYQCATTAHDDSCIDDFLGLVNQSYDLGLYIKDCSQSKKTWDRCMIERMDKNGKTELFHRGCHDGKTFEKDFESPRFQNLDPNNQTTCNYLGDELVCYTFCQHDLCNGPQVPEMTGSRCNDFVSYFDNNNNNNTNVRGFVCGAHRGGVFFGFVGPCVVVLAAILGSYWLSVS